MVSLDRDILRPTLIFVSYASNTATAAAMFFFFFLDIYLLLCFGLCVQ